MPRNQPTPLDLELAAVAAGTLPACGYTCDVSCHGGYTCVRGPHPDVEGNRAPHVAIENGSRVSWTGPCPPVWQDPQGVAITAEEVEAQAATHQAAMRANDGGITLKELLRPENLQALADELGPMLDKRAALMRRAAPEGRV